MKKNDIELANPGIFLEGFSRYQTAHPKILGGTQKSSNQGAGGGGCILKFNKHFQMFYFGWIFKPQELRKPAAFKFKIFDRFLDLPDRFFPFNSFCPETKLWTRH